jgi:hypothetical protein
VRVRAPRASPCDPSHSRVVSIMPNCMLRLVGAFLPRLARLANARRAFLWLRGFLGRRPLALHTGYEEIPCAFDAFHSHGMEKRRNAWADGRVCAVAIIARAGRFVTTYQVEMFRGTPARGRRQKNGPGVCSEAVRWPLATRGGEGRPRSRILVAPRRLVYACQKGFT